MAVYLLKMFGVSLLLTIGIELAVAGFVKIPLSRRNIQLIVLVNCLTNPAAVLLVWICGRMFPGVSGLLFQIPIEAVVILAEAVVYRLFAAEQGWDIQKPVQLAVIANMVSWLVGVLLQMM